MDICQTCTLQYILKNKCNHDLTQTPTAAINQYFCLKITKVTILADTRSIFQSNEHKLT